MLHVGAEETHIDGCECHSAFLVNSDDASRLRRIRSKENGVL